MDSSPAMDTSQANFSREFLPPTKIKRKYKCPACDHVTINPRENLYHRRDVHGHKIKVVECPLCVYACQYRQKLNRHLRLIHNRPQNSASNMRIMQPPEDYFSYHNYSQMSPPDEPLDLSFPNEFKLLMRILTNRY